MAQLLFRMGSAVSSRVDHWRNLHSATFDACSVGVEADGKQAKKPWCFVSSSERPIQKRTRYIMVQSLFPHVVSQHVCSMPCVARCQRPHRQKLVAGYPSVPLDIAMSRVGCKEVVTPAYVHRLLDRSERKNRPEVLNAFSSEKQGLLANGDMG